MSEPLSPEEVFDRAVEEGERRLDQSLLELTATSFIAGFTIVFGIVALGIIEAIFAEEFSSLAHLAGALAFGIGLVFLIGGRVELFNENFFDPTAAAVERDSWPVGPLLRLWGVTFALNLVGGCLFALVFVVEGALPTGTPEALVSVAEDSAARSPLGWFASAIAGGALVTLLSFLLSAAQSTDSRLGLAYVVGVMLALGPFDHVVVTVLHLVFGLLFGAEFGLATVGAMTAVVTAGNVVGGLGLVTVTHVAQAIGAEDSEG